MRSLGEALLALARERRYGRKRRVLLQDTPAIFGTNPRHASIHRCIVGVSNEVSSESTIGPSVMMVYADKLEKNGDIDEAKSVLNVIMSQYPESSQAATAKSMIDNELVGLTAEEQLEKILTEQIIVTS